MNHEIKSPPVSSPPLFDAGQACDECGAFGAFQIGDVHLYADCYAEKGSCCAGSGKDDLGRKSENDRAV